MGEEGGGLVRAPMEAFEKPSPIGALTQMPSPFRPGRRWTRPRPYGGVRVAIANGGSHIGAFTFRYGTRRGTGTDEESMALAYTNPIRPPTAPPSPQWWACGLWRLNRQPREREYARADKGRTVVERAWHLVGFL